MVNVYRFLSSVCVGTVLQIMQGGKEGVSVALELYVFSKRLQFADNELILPLMSCTTRHFKVLLQALALFPGMLIIIAESKRNVTITLRIFCLIQSAEMQIHMEVGKMLLYVYTK